jgi:hypothetical protein|tara:strand:+ start:404 stop:523 length:120 start_codon:yes stop_codon:yes gene_type:complete
MLSRFLFFGKGFVTTSEFFDQKKSWTVGNKKTDETIGLE